MIRTIAAAATFALLLTSGAVKAGEPSIVLTVHHAECAFCGPIVKRTLTSVHGVKAVQVSQPNEMADVKATVTFDGAVTNVAELVKATTNAGYPSELAK